MKRRTLPAVLLGAIARGAQNPSPGQAAYAKANAFFTARKFQECMNALDEALRQDPDLVPALTLKAKLAMAARRYDVAQESLKRALRADPASAYAQFLYGFQFYEQNQMPAAIEALEKARQLDPRDARAALYLGLARESQGDTRRALALYYEAIRLEQAARKLQASTLLTCFRLHLVLGEFDQAAPLVDRALRLEPASRDVQFQAARLRMKKGEPAAAATAGEAALKLPAGDATDRQIHFLLVQAYRRLGQDADAARHAGAIRATDER
jgi:tetratricopeptide (TPR) repeat protein